MSQKTYIAKFEEEFEEKTNPYIAHHLFGTQLSPKQKEMWNRYLHVRSLKAQGYPQSYITKALQNGIESEFAPTTMSNAHKIFREAIIIFGNPEPQKKAFEKWAKIEYCETMAMQVIEDARKENSDIDLAEAYKIAAKFTKMAIDLRGLLEKDQEGINPNDFANPNDWVFEITADPNALCEAAGENMTDFDEYEEVE